MKKFLNFLIILFLLFNSFPITIFAEGDFVANDEETTAETSQNSQNNEKIENSNTSIHTEEITYNEAKNALNKELEEGNKKENETLKNFEENYPVFNDTKIVDDIIISVNAEECVFPEGSKLSVEKVVYYVQKQVDSALDEVRNEEANVVASYTFDIKILDSEGNEIQPKDDSKVKVSFTLAEASNENLDTNVYHIDDKQEEITSNNVQTLDVVREGEEVVVETSGFSIYTVEFTYRNKEYVLTGDYWIKLSELLEQLDLAGNIESWQVSNSTLFDVCLGNDEEPSFNYYSDEEGNEFSTPTNIGDIPYLVSFKPFDTAEWLKVIIDGIEYEIVVTDSQVVIDGVTQDIPGVTQGQYISNFTEKMQVATIFIDETKVNQMAASGNSAEGEILSGYDTKGFYFSDSLSYSSRTGNVLHFDASKWKTTVDNGDGTTTEKTGFYPQTVDGVNYYWIDFPGDVVEYVFKDGAQSSTGTLYDVIVTFSDVRITLQSNVGSNLLSEVNSGKVTYSTFAGNAVLISNQFNEGSTFTSSTINSSPNNGRYGLMYNTNIRVVEDADAATRITVPGNFIYPMVDIDVDRSTQNNFRYFYESSKYRNYSEQIQITGNTFGDVFIPFQTSEEDSTGYKAGIENKEDGLLFYPRVTGDSDTLLTGFVTLANNSRGGINIRGWSAGSAGAGVETYLLTGGKVGSTPTVINHKIKSSTKTFKLDGSYEEDNTKGGTIETTQAGNQDGSLQDGTTILGPNILTVASGETVNYTMTPNIGYRANISYAKRGSLDYTEGSEITPTAVYDDDGVIKYYTYPFNRINEDNAIHVEWEPDVREIEVKKTTVDDIEGTFEYSIEFFTKKYYKAQTFNITVMAGISTEYEEETPITKPYYYFFNTGDPFVVNGITVPSGSFINGGTATGLDAICDALLDLIDENSISIHLGSELGTLSTELTTSVNEQIQALIDEEYTSAALDASVFTFSSAAREEEIPWAYETVPAGMSGENGTYTFKVSNGGSFTIPDVPNGVYYNLSEVNKDGWTCKSTNLISSRIKNTDASHTYINEYNSYDLTVEKQTVDNKEGSFPFTVKIYKDVEIPEQNMVVSVAASGSGGLAYYRLINNKQTFNIEYNNSTISIPSGMYEYGSGNEDLDNVINLLITMDETHSHEIKLNGENGNISTGETNPLSDRVQELLYEGYSMFALEPVTFDFASPSRIEQQGYNFETIPEGVEGEDGVFTFTLKNGKNKVLKGIPHGYEYEITEASDPAWELIKIEEDTSVEPVLLEFKDLSTITPTMHINNRQVTTSSGWVTGDHFQPQVNNGNTYMRLRYSTDGKTQQYTSSNHTVNYEDVIMLVYPNAVKMPDESEKDLIITLSDISIYNPENSMNVNFKGSIFRVTGGPAIALGSHGTGNIQRTPTNYTVNQKVKVSVGDSAKHEFFKVKYDDVEYEGNGFDGIEFNTSMSGSSRSFSTQPIQVLKAQDSHSGSGTETIDKPESPTYKNELDGSTKIIYTNKNATYDLSVKKETDIETDEEFNFKIKVWKEVKEATTPYSMEDYPINLRLEDKILLRVGHTWEDHTDPTVIIDEDDILTPGVEPPEFEYVLTALDGGPMVNNDTEYHFSPTNSESSLIEVPIPHLETPATYHYSIRCITPQGDDYYIDQRKADIEITYTGEYYKVKLNGNVPVSGQFGVISFVHYTGERPTGPDTDSNEWVFGTEPDYTTYEAPIDLSSQLGSPDEDGYYHFTLNNDESLTIPNIPYGYKYEVYELDDYGNNVAIGGTSDLKWILKSATNTSGTVTQDITSVFRNEAKNYKLTLKKKVSGNMGDKYKDFEFDVKFSSDENKKAFAYRVATATNAETITADVIINGVSCDKTQTYGANHVSENFTYNSVLEKINNNEISEYRINNEGFDKTYLYKTDATATINGEEYEIYANIPRDENETDYRSVVDYVVFGDPSLIDLEAGIGGRGQVILSDDTQLELLDPRIKSIEINDSKVTKVSDNEYKVILSHNESVEFKNILYGIKYEIVEQDYSEIGYKTTVDGESGREISDEMTADKNHLFENRNQVAVPTEVRVGYTVIPIVIVAMLLILYLKLRERSLNNE